MTDDDRFVRFGTALDRLNEDEIPSKKPINIEDQIVTDENGRRRFHGAFTGGFSAGYWNTVGSQEGWKPQTFKSSRSEKAEKLSRKPTDYMDDDDLGEFGIAPQRVQAKEDFSKDRKRKLQQQSYGPIPGVPVLSQMLEPSKDKVAVRLLKKMGWKPGQGIGARQTRTEKKTVKSRNDREMYVMQKYGCELAPSTSRTTGGTRDASDQSSSSEEEDVTFAPDDFEPFACAIKSNTFGLGYTGLGGLKESAVGRSLHVNLFDGIEILDKSNRKVSIRGQAFGVGALEEEDEDIYEKDDMSKYDFEMGGKKDKKKKRPISDQDLMVIEGFQGSSANSVYHKKIFSIKLPLSFVPRNWLVRKTRFAPMDEHQNSLLRKSVDHRKRGLGRHDLKPEERGSILGESSKKGNPWLEKIAQRSLNFEKSQVITEKGEEVNIYDSAKKENEKVLEKALEITKDIDTSGVFKPFAGNEEKQARYDKFIEAKLKDDDEITKFLDDLQPFKMSPWDREMEKKEFVQARKIYQPLQGIMGERFVTEATVVAEKEQEKPKYDDKNQVIVSRVKKMWKPCSLLCKRFNIPEPFGGSMIEEKTEKKNKFSVFDYLETSINKKSDFVTPVIIPKAKEAVKPLVVQTREHKDEEVKIREPVEEMTARDFFKASSSTQDVVNPPQTQKPLVKPKPKTELEMKIEERKDQHPAEKKDIFKAIFDDSEEEEESEEEKEMTTIPQEILTSLTKPAAEANLLRNTSPPRGIFAALFNSKPKEKTEILKENEKEVVPDLGPDQYGPKLPDNLLKPKTSDLDDKLLKLLKESKKEKWVEKSSSEKKSKKRKKEKLKKKRSRSSNDSDSSSDKRRKKKRKKEKKSRK
ncbi:GPATCH1 family protein [Megaselia abdita]